MTKQVGSNFNRRKVARTSYIAKFWILWTVQGSNLKIVNNSNGAAGPTLDALDTKLKQKGVKTNFVLVHHNPDPSFPNGIPNPLLEENRSSTTDIVIGEKADFGVAFDGDFDRCFFFDQYGDFIPGEYVVGLLAELFLSREQKATIIHDPRVIWNTIDVVSKCGGYAVVSKTGHSFVKAAMRATGAIYGGEMSAHHYFKDFAYCDSGTIPWNDLATFIRGRNPFLN